MGTPTEQMLKDLQDHVDCKETIERLRAALIRIEVIASNAMEVAGTPRRYQEIISEARGALTA